MLLALLLCPFLFAIRLATTTHPARSPSLLHHLCLYSLCRSCGTDAPWRRDRASHWDLLWRIRNRGLQPSPLMSAPGLRHTGFRVDWLHVMDKGVAADFLGSLFVTLLPKMEGATNQERLHCLFGHIQTYNRDHILDSQLDALTLGMFVPQRGASPKLSCKAAEARGLVPFARLAADRFLADDNPLECAVKIAARHLEALYAALSETPPIADPMSVQEHSRRYCLLMVSLEKADPTTWRVKPKMQEMLEMQEGRPAKVWTYRDEDFGGTVAGLQQRRGGRFSPASVARSVLQRFVAGNKFPFVAHGELV